MSVKTILASKETSLLIIEERKRKDIVIGVPHHAPAGVAHLPCNRVADENAGYIGRCIAKKLHCCSVIACNYPIDVNKFFRSDYTMQIASWNPKVLVEIHGHGGKKAKHDIEISSGSTENDKYSVSISQKIISRFSKDKDLQKITICGEYEKIYFKARQAVTISDQRWVSYHIELPPSFRLPSKDNEQHIPDFGCKLCKTLTSIIQETYGK